MKPHNYRRCFVVRVATQFLAGGIGVFVVVLVGYHLFQFYSSTDAYLRRAEKVSDNLVSSLEIRYDIPTGLLRKEIQPLAVYLQESTEFNKDYLKGIGWILIVLAGTSLVCMTSAIDALWSRYNNSNALAHKKTKDSDSISDNDDSAEDDKD